MITQSNKLRGAATAVVLEPCRTAAEVGVVVWDEENRESTCESTEPWSQLSGCSSCYEQLYCPLDITDLQKKMSHYLKWASKISVKSHSWRLLNYMWVKVHISNIAIRVSLVAFRCRHLSLLYNLSPAVCYFLNCKIVFGFKANLVDGDAAARHDIRIWGECSWDGLFPWQGLALSCLWLL